MNKEIAVLMAAGLGTRMRPLTEEIPKPLIKVYGVPLIETMINALRLRGVKEIYIVVGYKKEQFAYLEKKYKNLVLVENQEYLEKNNISSIYAVKNLLGKDDCFICESDIYVKNTEIFLTALSKSCYFGKKVSGYSDDWVFEMKGNWISQIRRGGTDLYNMSGVAFFQKREAVVLKNRIQEIYKEPETGKLFWDEVVNQIIPAIKIGIHEIQRDDLVEVDTIRELVEVDRSYIPWLK